MTIDQNDQSFSERKLDSVFSKAESAKKSVASKSQLSVEDEKMIQIQDDRNSILSKRTSTHS